MFWNKKPGPNPLGVSLGDLLPMLQPTSIKASLKGNTLVARHEHYTIRIDVVPPENRESENGPIRAVVRMTTELPKPILKHFREPELTVPMNAFAALGALSSDQGSVYIGSRLTIYEAEDAWPTLHLPLLLFTTIAGTEAILGAMRRTFTNEGFRGGASEWTEDDFEQVEGSLSRVCVCTTGGLGLTAEFGLSEGAISAMSGDLRTALFQLKGDQPHPELGGGLFCLLQMPHQLPDEKRLRQVCVQLNNMEMAARDLPPHFGAWCEGKLGNPAYVSFFPNALRAVSGIAVNASFWAMNRAEWANGMLASLGVSPPASISRRDELTAHPLLRIARLKYSQGSIEQTLVLQFLNAQFNSEGFASAEDYSADDSTLAMWVRDARSFAEEILLVEPQTCAAMFGVAGDQALEEVRQLFLRELGARPSKLDDRDLTVALMKWAKRRLGLEDSDYRAQLWEFVVEIIDAALWLGWLFPRDVS